VIPAGDDAKGYIAAGFNLPGTSFSGDAGHLKNVYKKGKGRWRTPRASARSTTARRRGRGSSPRKRSARPSAVRKGKADDRASRCAGGIEHLNIDDKCLKELGAVGLMQSLKVSCMDMRGAGGQVLSGTARSGT